LDLKVDTKIVEKISDMPEQKSSIFKVYDLLNSYDKDKLVLMVAPSYYLYVYWEISIAKEKELVEKEVKRTHNTVFYETVNNGIKKG